MPTRWVIGLAASEALHGVDAALVELDGHGLDLRVRLVHALAQPFARDLRELLIGVTTMGRADSRQTALAHRAAGDSLASAARLVADRASVSLQQILCVGCQGVLTGQEPESRLPTLLELGAPELVAERTGLTTLGNFRWRDLAAGGQSGPIHALADLLLLGSPDESRLHIHLGGITQVTFLPHERGTRSPAGWDAGPGAVFLDALIQTISGGKDLSDEGGKLAVQGRQIPELLRTWSQHPFLLRKPPKCLARGVFAEEFARQAVNLAVQRGWNPHDLLCTANQLVIRAVGESVKRHLTKSAFARIVLSGSGARNGLLCRLLEDQFPGTPIERSDAYGLPAEALDAVRPAVLACLTLDGEPANLPSVTGARGSRLLGNLTPGSPSNWSRCLDWMTGQECAAIVGEEE